jgi:hypothetical protein
MKTVIVAIAIVAVGYLVWSRYFSQDAKIERAYQACVNKINAGMDKAKADMAAQNSSSNNPGDALAKGMAEAMVTAMQQGMTGPMCGMIKGACKEDFNGPFCQAALNSSR